MNLAIDVEPKPPGSAPGAKRLSLRKNFSWTFAGNTFYALTQWGFLILLAKWLMPASVGQFAFALAVTAPIMIFANQGLTGLQATDAKDEFSFGEYFLCRLATTSLGLLLIFVLYRLFGWSEIVLMVAAAKAAESVCDIKYGLYQKLDRMDRTAQSMTLRGACSLLAAAILLSFFHSVLAATIGLVLGNLLILVFKDYRNDLIMAVCKPGKAFAEAERFLNDRARLRGLLWQAFPLGLAAMLGSAISGIPRYFIEHYSGTAQLGIFAALMYLLIAGRTLIVAVAQSCVAQLSRYYAHGAVRLFDKLLLQQLLLGLAMGVAGVLISVFAGRLILRLLYRSEYAEYSNIFVLVMVAATLNYLAEFSNVGLLAIRSIAVQPIILTVCCTVIFLLSFFLVPAFGLLGAAWAVVITAAIQLLANLYVLARSPFRKLA